jgi:hypothetical protein
MPSSMSGYRLVMALYSADGCVGSAGFSRLRGIEDVYGVGRSAGHIRGRHGGRPHRQHDTRALLHNVDCIVHVAAHVPVTRERVRVRATGSDAANAAATMKLATTAIARNVKRFVFVSSVEVGGEALRGAPWPSGSTLRPFRRVRREQGRRQARTASTGADGGLQVVVALPRLVYGAGIGCDLLTHMRHIGQGVPLPLVWCEIEEAVPLPQSRRTAHLALSARGRRRAELAGFRREGVLLAGTDRGDGSGAAPPRTVHLRARGGAPASREHGRRSQQRQCLVESLEVAASPCVTAARLESTA